MPPAQANGATIPLTTGELPMEARQARWRHGRIVTREEAIPIIQNYLELDMKQLKEAKDDEAMRKALDRLEHSVRMMKELLAFDPKGKKR